MSESSCSVEGCERPAYARGWCQAHYGRWRQHGDVRADVPVGQWGSGHKALCSVSDCQRSTHALGWCKAHYKRWKKTGDVQADVPLNSRSRRAGEGTIDIHGYRVIKIGGRKRPEHRMVMEQYLGRPLATHETVHHKNGRRSQNDIGNLELWVVPQPYGQRPVDLAEWVVEMCTPSSSRPPSPSGGSSAFSSDRGARATLGPWLAQVWMRRRPRSLTTFAPEPRSAKFLTATA